jgi:hypothetical protein
MVASATTALGSLSCAGDPITKDQGVHVMIRTRSAKPSTVSMVGLAMLVGIGLGIAYAPAVAVGQGIDDDVVLTLQQGKPLPNGAYQVLGKNRIRLVRVVKQVSTSPPVYGIDTYYRKSGDQVPRDEDDAAEMNKPPFVDWNIVNDPSSDYVDVSARIKKSYLLEQADNPSDPIDVLSASVILQVGTDTCIWDCYWANGRKICECIKI